MFLAVLLVVLLGLLPLQGVIAQDPVTLTVLVEIGGLSLQKAAAQLFEEQTGHTVEIVEVPYASVLESLSAEMAVGGSSYDVATIDVIWIPAFADFAESLDDLFTDEVKADLVPALLADSLWNGRHIGMPTWANAEVIYYRKDLWEDPDEQAAFQAEYGYELAPPTNWQEFTDMATFFTRDTDGDGSIDLYGTDVKGAPPGADVEWMVHVLQAGSPGVVLDADGHIIVDNDAHLAGLEYYVSHHCELGLTPPNPLEIGWGEGENLFFQGATAMTRFWGHAYRLQQFDGLASGNYLGPEAVSHVGVAPMIAGEAGIGSIPGPWFNIIPQTSENKEVAKEFVQFLYEQNALGVETPLGLSARNSAFEQFAGQENYENITALVTTLNGSQTIGRPLVANWQQVSDEVVVPMVQDALSCEVSPADALAWAREELEAMGFE
ncbi:MAG: extracellular solute-binding protein [Chloroflexi bacterium]|nr:extracellular solute-binding protein [Anaerolineaceae bacterium]MCY4106210.1 extracellular solute-binding protein [Chloroflexota bacterium]